MRVVIVNSIFSLSKSYRDKILISLIVAIFFLTTLGVFATYNSVVQTARGIVSWAFPGTPVTTEIENVVIGGLQDMDVLTTARISNRATIKATRDRKLSRLQIGQTNLIYEGVGTVEAGINIEAIQITNNKKKHQIQVELPSAYLKSISLDINKSGIIDTYKKWLGANVEKDLLEEAQQEALAAVRAEACSTKIIRKANKQAKELVENLTSGFEDIDIVVTVAEPSVNSCRLKA